MGKMPLSQLELSHLKAGPTFEGLTLTPWVNGNNRMAYSFFKALGVRGVALGGAAGRGKEAG